MSNGSRFQFHVDATVRRVRGSGEKYNSERISTTVKHGGRGVIVWGALSAAGTGERFHSEKPINAL